MTAARSVRGGRRRWFGRLIDRHAIGRIALGFAITPVVLIGYASLLAAWLDRNIDDWGRHEAAVEMTRSLFAAVDHFRRDNQRVPTQAERLEALVPQYLRRVPLDPWGNPFVYRTQGGDWADLVSLGADGSPGGVGLATDISARYGSPGTTPSRSLVTILFVLLVLIPVAAFAVAAAGGSSAPALSGIAVFWAWAVAVTVAPNANMSVGLIGAFAAIAVALAGAVLALRRDRAGALCGLVGTLACQVATAAMMA